MSSKNKFKDVDKSSLKFPVYSSSVPGCGKTYQLNYFMDSKKVPVYSSSVPGCGKTQINLINNNIINSKKIP